MVRILAAALGNLYRRLDADQERSVTRGSKAICVGHQASGLGLGNPCTITGAAG